MSIKGRQLTIYLGLLGLACFLIQGALATYQNRFQVILSSQDLDSRESRSQHPQNDRERQGSEFNLQAQKDLKYDQKFKAAHPWHIVFVSKDGPGGHQSQHPGNCNSSVWCAIWAGAKQAGEAAGVEIELAYAPQECEGDRDCTNVQVQAIERIIGQGDVDGMIVGPRDSNRLVPAIEKAISKGIPVLIVDTPLNSDKVITQLIPDNYRMGESLALWVASQVGEGGNVLLLNGALNEFNSLERQKGILAGLKHSNINVLDEASAKNWSQQEAQTIVRQWLAEFSDIDAAIAASGNMAIGVIEAVQSQGRDEILIASFDLDPRVKRAIAAGDLGATVDQRFSLQGQLGLQLLVKHLERGQSLPDVIYVPDVRLITAETLPSLAEE